MMVMRHATIDVVHGMLPATASAEGAQLNAPPFPATASAEGAQLNAPPFPATASAEGAQLNAPPSPEALEPAYRLLHDRRPHDTVPVGVGCWGANWRIWL